jgi:hypothetical protein
MVHYIKIMLDLLNTSARLFAFKQEINPWEQKTCRELIPAGFA